MNKFLQRDNTIYKALLHEYIHTTYARIYMSSGTGSPHLLYISTGDTAGLYRVTGEYMQTYAAKHINAIHLKFCVALWDMYSMSGMAVTYIHNSQVL